MKRQPYISRRRFVTAMAAGAGGMWLLGAPKYAASQTDDPPEYPSTDHFWYRRPTEGPYVDSQRANKAFGFSGEAVYLSEDNGRTWPHKLAFPNAANVTFSYILRNGNVLFATRARLYLSTDNLKSYRQLTVKDAAGRRTSPTPQSTPCCSTRGTNAVS